MYKNTFQTVSFTVMRVCLAIGFLVWFGVRTAFRPNVPTYRVLNVTVNIRELNLAL